MTQKTNRGILLFALLLTALLLASGCAAKKQIIIDQSGNGTYTSIRAGLRDWVEGQSITIREGNYNEQIILQTNMQIVGEGSVVVDYSGDGPTVSARDVSSVVVRNITLRRSGQSDHPTVRLRGADVQFDRCAVNGGKVAGIESLHFGMLTLTNSLISGNGWAGIYLHDQARAMIEESTIEENERGIAVVAYPSGIPPKQTIYRDADTVPVLIKSSEIMNNSLLGVMLASGSDANISQTVISGNAASNVEAGEESTFNMDAAGILVKDRSTMHLKQSQILNNLLGVSFQAYGGGSVQDSTIGKNHHYGILCTGQGKPEIINNLLEKNGSAILIREGNQSLVSGNRISDNRFQGIEVGDSGLPMIEKNIIARNAQSGLFVFDSAKPTVRYNVVAHNGWYGLLIARGAKPLVFNNTFVDNKRKGVWFTQKAEGVLANNAIIGGTVGLSIKANKEIVPRIQANLLWGADVLFEAFVEAPASFIQNPQFANPDKGDYRPQPGSPLITLGEGKGYIGAFEQTATGEAPVESAAEGS